MPANPYIRFFPDSWMNDAALRKCSRHTRATWMDLLCLAHQGYPYGHLADQNGALTVKFMANWCEVTPSQLAVAIGELEKHGVLSRNGAGIIYSRRMVRDEEVRQKRASGGPQSLKNPNVPKKKGYPQGPDTCGVLKDAPIDIDIDIDSSKDQVTEKIQVIKALPTFEADCQKIWDWFCREFSGEINPSWDCQIFMSVMQTFEDLADLKKNLPRWKACEKWQNGYVPTAENFLRKRIFKTQPKAVARSPDGPAPSMYTEWKGTVPR